MDETKAAAATFVVGQMQRAQNEARTHEISSFLQIDIFSFDEEVSYSDSRLDVI